MTLTVLTKGMTSSPPTFRGSSAQTQKPVPDDSMFVDGTSSENLYYASYSHFQQDFSVGLHPHSFFEIHTYVIEGVASHFDTSIKAWVDLSGGSLQIMKTGSGMFHSEKITAGFRGFQLWFTTPFHSLPIDRHPPPTYSVHPPLEVLSEDTQQHPATCFSILPIVGLGSDVPSDVPGLEMCRLLCSAGCASSPLPLPSRAGGAAAAGGEQVGLLFVLEGRLDVKEGKGGRKSTLSKDDAVIVRGAAEIWALDVQEGCDLFYVSTPKKRSGGGR